MNISKLFFVVAIAAIAFAAPTFARTEIVVNDGVRNLRYEISCDFSAWKQVGDKICVVTEIEKLFVVRNDLLSDEDLCTLFTGEYCGRLPPILVTDCFLQAVC